MQAGVEFGLQEVGDRPVTGDAADAFKGLRDDPDPHMGLAFAVHSGLVAGVLRALVQHRQPLGRERLRQFFLDIVSDDHCRRRFDPIYEASVTTAPNIPTSRHKSDLSILADLSSDIHNRIMKLDSKYFDKIRTRRRPAPDQEVVKPTCQWDGCDKPGVHRAPVGRNAEGQFFLFCFEHVKEYNKGYNYFSGLSDNDIARYQKEAITGHRPTWTIGVNKTARSSPLHSTARSGSAASQARIRDPFGFVGEQRGNGPRLQPKERKLKSLELQAFETLGLPGHSPAPAIKSRYKELVKKHHPDANGGDRGSEDRFRAVIQAYQLLKQAGFC